MEMVAEKLGSNSRSDDLVDELYLNIAMTMAKSRANGPGLRVVIWVQGCTIGCRGCYNAFTHPHAQNQLVSPTELAEWVRSIEGIEGVTFSGGEPFEQARAILNTIQLINAESVNPLSVFIFSGFTLAELESSVDPSVRSLLSKVDILSAGRYIASKRSENLLWKGSTNQELYFLSNRYNPDMEERWLSESPVEELVMTNEGVQRTGFLGVGGPLLNGLVSGSSSSTNFDRC